MNTLDYVLIAMSLLWMIRVAGICIYCAGLDEHLQDFYLDKIIGWKDFLGVLAICTLTIKFLVQWLTK